MVTGDVLAAWLSRLVRIPSVSPSHAGPRAGVPGEARIAAAVAEWFRDFGGEVTLHEVLPGRPNVYGIWRGQTERWAGVDVHVDTVSVEQMTGDPFSGVVAGRRVHGRGAVDTKATLAVVLALLDRMHASGERPVPNLIVGATIDEEDGARGAPAFAAWLREQGLTLDELAVAEPTGCAPIVAHKGVLRIAFTIEGTPAHSSQPHLGANAVTAAAALVLAFDEENRRLANSKDEGGRMKDEPGTLTVTTIQGGRGANVVPDGCTLGIDRRLAPGENGRVVAEELLRLAAEACTLPLSAEVIKQINPFLQPSDSPWVRRLAAWSGRDPAVAPYCTNAWAYPDVARERVVIGPGSIEQAHGSEEWVEIAELEKLAAIYGRWLLEG